MKNPILLMFLTLCAVTAAFGQKGKAATGLPKLVSSWGRTPSGNITPKQVISLADSSLRVNDNKGNEYPVSGFRINYTFLSTYKDSESGELKTSKEFRAFDFNDTTHLNQVWKESISDNVKSGDEILFNKITARQKNGKKLNAPDIRFRVMEK
jgi:hypothetical protein